MSFPRPTSFSATTRNWYSLPSLRSERVFVVDLGETSVSGDQFPDVSLASMMYFLIGAPPSSTGGCHDSVTDSGVILLARTLPEGAPGLTTTNTIKEID